MSIDIIEGARRITFVLLQEEYRIFGKNLGGSSEQFIDRLLSAGALVDPTVYKLAFILRGGHIGFDDGPDVRLGS